MLLGHTGDQHKMKLTFGVFEYVNDLKSILQSKYKQIFDEVAVSLVH